MSGNSKIELGCSYKVTMESGEKKTIVVHGRVNEHTEVSADWKISVDGVEQEFSSVENAFGVYREVIKDG